MRAEYIRSLAAPTVGGGLTVWRNEQEWSGLANQTSCPLRYLPGSPLPTAILSRLVLLETNNARLLFTCCQGNTFCVPDTCFFCVYYYSTIWSFLGLLSLTIIISHFLKIKIKICYFLLYLTWPDGGPLPIKSNFTIIISFIIPKNYFYTILGSRKSFLRTLATSLRFHFFQ